MKLKRMLVEHSTVVFLSLIVVILVLFGVILLEHRADWVFGAVNSGIVGTTVALIAAILVYLAFTEQKKSLDAQKEELDLQKASMLQQQKLNEKQHAITHFYELFRVIKESGEKVEFGKLTGKKAFVLLDKEFRVCFTIISNFLAKKDVTIANFEDKVDLAYIFFYYGVADNDACSKILSTEFAYLSDKSIVQELILEFQKWLKEDTAHIDAGFFNGHDLELSPYYRLLFQTVEDMNKMNDEIISYTEKYDFIKNIRALMSSQEQAVFLYNALSRYGRNWELSKEKEDDKLITKYQFIRNIPQGLSDFEYEIKRIFPNIFWENEGSDIGKKTKRKNWELASYGSTQIRINERKEPKIIALIPARMDASRFDGKLMAPLKGIPVIRRTYNTAVGMNLFAEVFVVTNSSVIYNEIVSNGGKAILNEREHKSGSDRIAEAAEKLDADIIINIQGDEPFTKKYSIERIISEFKKDTEEKIGVVSLMQKLEKEEHILDQNYVKVVVDKDSNALYFSRSVIPRISSFATNYYEHIGVYGFRKSALLEFYKTPKGYLEERESVECLRYLENGIAIKMVITPYMGIEIDTPEDLKNAEILLEQEELIAKQTEV